MEAVRSRVDHDEAAAPGILLTNEREAACRLVVTLDDDVLEEVAEACFDRALVAAVDVEIIRDGALLTHLAVGLHQHHPGGVAELTAGGVELDQRRQARFAAGQLLLAI